MSEVVRLYRYKSLLSNRTAVSAEDLILEQLEHGLLGAKLTCLVCRPPPIMKPFALSLSKGFSIKAVVRQAHHERQYFTLKPMKWRLSHLIDKHGLASQNVAQRIRLAHADKRKDLNAWCHLRGNVRNFSIDAITKLEMLETDAKAVTVKAIDQALGSSYGIFNGATQGWAKLKFTAERARWVAGETWHAMLESSFEADGSYQLSFPYSDDRELLGDILRYCSDVQVLAPAALRSKVQRCFLEAAARYV